MIAGNKEELIRYCLANDVRVMNFHYCGTDTHLKTLTFALRDRSHLENILEAGERVDGSSLFPFLEAGRSDLYVIPVYRTAFRNPFSEVPAVDVLCQFFDRDGKPFGNSSRYVLSKAARCFKEHTGLEMQAMGELEYYVMAPEQPLYPVKEQKGYHESVPFCKYEDLRTEAMLLITAAGGKVKYGHSEVGNFTRDGILYEQNEIEFTPDDIEDAADQLVIAQWIMRQLAWRRGVTISFEPKLSVGEAGSGLHIHCKFTRDGKSVMTENGELSAVARKAIAGLMDMGTSLPAWGNPSLNSYQRLVPNQEAPTSLCWSYSNRSALVRVPLGWASGIDMAGIANPGEKSQACDFSAKQTFEWRASDASADIYLLMAALCCAARHGICTLPDADAVARRTYVDLGVNIHDSSNREIKDSLEQLPSDMAGAADELEKDRKVYTLDGVFPDELVDYQIEYLKHDR